MGCPRVANEGGWRVRRNRGTDRARAKALRAGLRLRVPPPRIQRSKTKPTRAEGREALRREHPELRM